MKYKILGLTVLLASPGIWAANLSVSTTTNSRDFPLSADRPLVIPLAKDSYTVKISDITGDCRAPDKQKIRFSKPIALNCGTDTRLPLKIHFSGDYAFSYDAVAHTLSVTRQAQKATETEFKRPFPNVQCEARISDVVTIILNDTFTDGTELRDAFTGKTAIVQSGKVSFIPSKESGGLVLLEPVEKPQAKTTLNWRNANIYFVMVDRFNNADHTNDHSYGRHKDGKDEVGTFHGGDLKGVTEKLDYIKSLGTDAIWLSPIVEQIHGFVGGGESGSFPFYGYHGYWARDFTKIDENFGSETDLQQLIQEAHKRGIKVLFDAVINHAGYSSLADLQFDHIDVVTPGTTWPTKWAGWTPETNQNWHSYQSHINKQSIAWKNWWGSNWVRSSLPGYPQPGTSDTTLSLAGLPDFLTESDTPVIPPKWLLNNPGTRVLARQHYRVSDYLIEWQTDWVKRFGIDGFRVDTVKHVEGDIWKRLKTEASRSLKLWQKTHNQTEQPFFMMGEVWGHSAYRSPYFDDGFDALINFDMQKKMDKGATCFSQMADTYQSYADTLRTEPDFNPVSYMSSHDTELFFSRFKSIEMQKAAANALLLSPGAVQVYYGDEIARNIGPYADDFHQGTRSDMLWKLDDQRKSLLKHWQTVGRFRHSHPAIGAGEHKVLEQENAYVFSRTLGNDKVVIAFVGQ